MVARSRRVTTHLRAVWELLVTPRSSRWLSHEEVALLFACASFGRSLRRRIHPWASLLTVAPASTCAWQARMVGA